MGYNIGSGFLSANGITNTNNQEIIDLNYMKNHNLKAIYKCTLLINSGLPCNIILNNDGIQRVITENMPVFETSSEDVFITSLKIVESNVNYEFKYYLC